MTAQKGSLLLLKIGNAAIPEVFTTIGGLRSTSFTHHNQPFDASNLESGAWKQLLENAGSRSITISGAGIFTDSAAEATLRGIAMNNQIRNYRLSFGNGDMMTGPFLVSAYQRSGDYDGAEQYSQSLTSAGAIQFTKST